ncbi:exodeoxyribonuclease 7 large subunit [Clostridium sp. CAG:921]|nr:exodeoxyribonuclease 7 large subunit [Clostridium sp. CAG:921]
MESNVYSVSQINRYIKMLIDKDAYLNSITVRGEITNFKAHYTGHFYFTLKDETSTIKCVMFKSMASLVKFKPADGMKVVITGQVSLFERDGTYQIYCKTMVPEGVGELYLAYEQLKEKLVKEGLFDVKYKKKIPFLPNRVGVITSKTGAVVRDIINVSTRRYPNVNLCIFPAAVQGVNVASTVIEGIETFNRLNNVDVIIIARGGGSFEDLFGFNDESLARKIFESNIPIVSAVGHETDFTICDFVSDLRAPTPSAAAELVYPRYSDIISKISVNENRVLIATKNYLIRKREYVKRIMASKLEKVPLDMINKYKMEIDKSIAISENAMCLKLEKYKSKSSNLISKLDALSPLKTLSRGYSVVENENHKVIKSKNDVEVGNNISITFSDGKINATVKE